jgi:hypothetical protein
MVIEKDNTIRFVIKINLGELLTPSDFQTIYKLLFTDINKTQNIQALIHKICIKTRTKMTLKDDNDKDEVLIYWRYDPNLATLRSFESDLISLYHEKEDKRKFNLLNHNTNFRLIGTNTVRQLSPPELMYLRTQLENYINRKKPLGEIELL